MIFVVSYTYDPSQSDTIDEVRPVHREFLAGLHAAGTLLASGPWVGEAAGAYLLMTTPTGEEALTALDADPFAAAGVISERTVQAWNPTIGSLA